MTYAEKLILKHEWLTKILCTKFLLMPDWAEWVNAQVKNGGSK